MMMAIGVVIGVLTTIIMMSLCRVASDSDDALETQNEQELDFQHTILRPVCDEIMTITEADEEQTYATLQDHVKAWGCRQFSEGLIHGRNER